MKKILFATTALVATASVAAADVTFSGYGRFGVKYSGSVAKTAAKAGEWTAAENVASTGIAATAIAVGKTYSGTAGAIATKDTSSAAVATVQADITKLSATRAAIVALQAVQAAGQLASVGTGFQADGSAIGAGTEATKTAAQLAADLKSVDAAIAAASGTAEVAAIASDTLVTSRLRLNIAASTESDSGVTFGMSVRVQQDEGNTNSFNAARFYAKSGGLELAVGNIYGVIDNMAGLYSGSVGLTGLGWGNVVSNFGSLAYSSGGAGSAGTKEAAEVIYSMGDYGFAVATDGTDTEYGVSATMSGWTVALSASDTDTAANSEWVATVGGSIGGVKVGLATAEAVNGNSSTTLSAAFDVAAATSVTVYYNDDEANTIDDKSYGLGVVHGLGGGASLRGGIVSVNDRTLADFGVLFNF
ncbi:porin [Lentibacter algarum]|uniref:porin n=1 Tax=Lentibacter algarum TaxID=576131 RepID=UPI0024E04C99|nr:porin [Lentibacter algarum]WIF33386.1 porin [Lentibacter algarum]